MPKHFITNCVSSTYEAIHPMVEAEKEITQRSFLKHVDREELRDIAGQLGYYQYPKQGLTMAADWAIAYYKSTFEGQPCVFFRWSCIEYVFA